jgi:hypothetical protein
MRACVTGILVALLSCVVVKTAAAQTFEAGPGSLTDAASLQWSADSRLRYVARNSELAGPGRSRPQLIAAARSDRRTARALMIVGAAGIVTGLIVDESIVTIAGAGVGGYGLYLYLR